MRERVVVMDGAMGTLLQQQGLAEADFRGERFADWDRDLQGNNDLLSLTQPELIERLHTEYLDAGADIAAIGRSERSSHSSSRRAAGNCRCSGAATVR